MFGSFLWNARLHFAQTFAIRIVFEIVLMLAKIRRCWRMFVFCFWFYSFVWSVIHVIVIWNMFRSLSFLFSFCFVLFLECFFFFSADFAKAFGYESSIHAQIALQRLIISLYSTNKRSRRIGIPTHMCIVYINHLVNMIPAAAMSSPRCITFLFCSLNKHIPVCPMAHQSTRIYAYV